MHYPVIPWIGGKRRLAKKIIPLFPQHECYVEPFAGAAALFFMKEPTKVEVLNDINSDLVNLYRVIQHNTDEFVRQFRWALNSREMFRLMQITDIEPLTDVQRAARFYYLQKLSFGGKVSGQTFGTGTTRAPRLNPYRLEEDISQAHMRLARTYIEHLPWQECIRRYDRPHTLFYCDPPYWGTVGYGVEFGLEQYDELASMMRSISGKMIVSVNDIPEMRQAFSGLTMERVPVRYTVSDNKNPSERFELIIQK